MKGISFDGLLPYVPGSYHKSRLPGFKAGEISTAFMPGKGVVGSAEHASLVRVLSNPEIIGAINRAKISGKHTKLPDAEGERVSMRHRPTRAKVIFNPHTKSKVGWRERGLLFVRTSFGNASEAHTKYGVKDEESTGPKLVKKGQRNARKFAKDGTLLPEPVQILPPEARRNNWSISMFLNTKTNQFVVVKEEVCNDNNLECREDRCNHDPGEAFRFDTYREGLDMYQEFIRAA